MWSSPSMKAPASASSSSARATTARLLPWARAGTLAFWWLLLSYAMLAGRQIPLSEANHRRYGVSSTPTLVLVDRRGIIRLYRPGKMTEEELSPIIERLVSEGT